VQYADGGTASGRWPKNNRFHTAALCSPTRQALLTGRNHHTVGMGGITEIATGSPGYNSVLPNICSPIARTLKLNGYAAARFGKCHEVPVGETSPAGPFDAWPTGGGGFEYFYGFLGGEANQWYPSLYEGTTPIEVRSAQPRPSSSPAMMVATWGWTRGLPFHRTTGREGTSFQVASRAFNSPSPRMLRALITWSPRRKLSVSPWRGSKHSRGGSRHSGSKRSLIMDREGPWPARHPVAYHDRRYRQKSVPNRPPPRPQSRTEEAPGLS
jgi:hypothetical protein